MAPRVEVEQREPTAEAEIETTDGAGETIYVPYEMKVSIDPLTACIMEVSSEDLTGAWDFNEWEEDITVFVT